MVHYSQQWYNDIGGRFYSVQIFKPSCQVYCTLKIKKTSDIKCLTEHLTVDFKNGIGHVQHKLICM